MHRFLRPRLAARLLATLLLAGGAGCDYPSALPTWDTRWEVPSDSAFLRVDLLLPPRIAVTTDRSAFGFTLDPVTVARSLGAACGSCAALQGQAAPKPAFTLNASGSASLPADVRAVNLVSGTVTVSVVNGFGFDPLRPSATARGSLSLVVTSGGRTVASTVIDGAATAFPAGTTLVRQLPLAAGPLAGSLDVSASLVSPAGDAVAVDTAQRVTITATVSEARAAGATIAVADHAVGFDDMALDVAGIDDAMIARVQGGALVLDVTNPFAVAGTGTATIAVAGTTIVQPFAIAQGTSTVTVPFTRDELRAFLGHADVRLSLTADVTAPTGTTAVTPDEQLLIASRLRLTLSSTER